MERRVLLAILLSAAVMYGYQVLVPPPPVTPPPTNETPVANPSTATAAVAATSQPPAPDTPTATVTATDDVDREIVIETATTEVTLANTGARVVRWRIKNYLDEGGEPVDLVPSGLPASENRPFSLQVDDAALTRQLNTVRYRTSGDVPTAGGVPARVDARESRATIVFDYADSSGLVVKKTFVFDPRNYTVSFTATVSNGGRTIVPGIAWGPGLADAGAKAGGGSFFTGNYVQPPQGILDRGAKAERIARTAIGEQPRHEGNFRFIGVDDHYFLAAVINPGMLRVDYRPVDVPDALGAQRQLLAQTITPPSLNTPLRFFVGPKQFDLLQSIDQELVRAIDYGMFAWLVIPLLSALKWLHAYLGNYGWAIVILTLAINLVLAPLRHKSVVAMRRMQEIQPQLKAIQDRYAGLKVTDPARQKMNGEIMELYKTAGANPASGCLPMLATMPVLLAFYSLLSMSIELRGAPFVGWIHDLSARDPYFVLPGLMGVTMFWQQWITPSTADPVQQRVMMIMPLMFTGIMASSPSGAVLYWFIGQAWAIGQQYFTNWLIGPPKAVAARPAAERRLKNVGAGRTSAADKRP